MQLDTSLGVDFDGSLAATVDRARRAEALGFAALWSAETRHDPFLPLVLAAEHTQRIQLGTGIAVAFARSPLTIAQLAWDLQAASHGRFMLGLGTQVKAHIERRFGMPWEHPTPRLREYITAIRQIWQCWQTGAPLNFRGEFFKLTLMTPFFNPGPIQHPNIPILIAGVNAHLCELAGEMCDGFHVHPFHTPQYLAEFVLPHLDIGAARGGRRRADIALASSVFVIAGDSPQERDQARADVRRQLAFYASTPSYRVVMDLHGWSGEAAQLSALAARGRWDDMPALVSDGMLAAFAEEGSWDEIGSRVRRRYAGLLDRVALYRGSPDAAAPALLRAFHAGG